MDAENRQRIDKILDFWFEEREFDTPQIDARMDFWFSDNAQTDETIRRDFGDDMQRASDGQLEHWGDEAEGRLALILLIDQFRRNAYRSDARAFSHDDLALKLCVEGIVYEQDKILSPVQRVFFYMPLQHSERLSVQEKSVRAFHNLSESVSETLKTTFETFTQFAELHHQIILQFGRFPHRNAVLERKNTPEESEYLGSDAPTFGQ